MITKRRTFVAGLVLAIAIATGAYASPPTGGCTRSNLSVFGIMYYSVQPTKGGFVVRTMSDEIGNDEKATVRREYFVPGKVAPTITVVGGKKTKEIVDRAKVGRSLCPAAKK